MFRLDDEMEEAAFSKAQVFLYQTTRRLIPEGCKFQLMYCPLQ
jgi:hypothetical protein